MVSIVSLWRSGLPGTAGENVNFHTNRGATRGGLMKRVYFLVVLVVFLAAFIGGERIADSEASVARPAAPGQPSLPSQGPKVVHTVFFWFKEGTSEEQKQKLIEDCGTLLRSVSSVRYVAAGPPAATAGGVVDNSYGVGLVVHFDDAAGLEHYANAPKHLEFIQRHREIWERVQVYDFQVQ